MVNTMPEIVDVGKTGITDFSIRRGKGEPTSNFNVNYYPCDGEEDERLKSGALINLYLSDPQTTHGYEDIFKGIADNVNEIENNEGISYSIQGRDLAALMAYQKYKLYGGLSPPKSTGTSFLNYGGPGTGHATRGDMVDLWGEILAIMQDTPLNRLKTSLPEWGETQFKATEWWSYRTDAAETVNGVEYTQGQWHTNQKQRIVVTPQEMTKVAALDEILNNAIGIGSHLGKYGWCVDNGGALIIFRIDKPEHIIDLDIGLDYVSEISIGDDSTGVTNACQGYGHNTIVKTVEPASTKRIEAYIQDDASISRFWRRDASTIDNPDLNYEELALTCQNSIDPKPKYHITVTLNNYSNISPATAIRIPNRQKAAGKIFTVTDYTIQGQQGDYTTVLEGEIWGRVVSNPTAYQSIQKLARQEVSKLYGIPCSPVDIDESAGMVKVVLDGTPQWIRYLRGGS